MKIINLLHIPKTGGSCRYNSMKWIKVMNGDDELVCLPTNTGDLVVRCHHSRLMNPVSENDYFVLFLRSPVKKFISGFISRLREGRPLYDTPHSEAEKVTFSLYQDPESLALDLYHNNSQIREIARRSLDAIIHLKMSFKSYFISFQNLNTYSDRILYVGRTEELTHDFAQLQAQIGLDSVELTSDPVLAHVTPVEYKAIEQISDQARRNIMKFYFEDYAMIAKLMYLNYIPKNYLLSEFEELIHMPEFIELCNREQIPLNIFNIDGSS